MPKTKNLVDRERGLATAIQVCRKVVANAEATGNCGVCGEEFDAHTDDCPYEKAVEALDLLGIKR